MNTEEPPARPRPLAALRTLIPFLRPYRGLVAGWLAFLTLSSSATLEHPGLEGLYPCGEGAGYAGGIVSAALDGRRCAEAMAQQATR